MTNTSLAELTAQLRSPGLTLFDGPAGDLKTIAADTLGVVGMPTDWTQSSRIGTRMGPRALRRATSEWIRALRAQGGDVWIDPRTESAWQLRMDDWLLDCGDAHIDLTSVERTTKSIALMTEAVRLRDAIPLALGGDHYNSYPACLGYSRAFEQLQPGKRFGYIQIDGHLDFADKLGAWGTHNHATNGRRNSELPNIAQENMVWIGITGRVDGGELEQIEGMGGKIFSSGDIHRLGTQEVAEQALAHAMRGCDHLYLSIDTPKAEALKDVHAVVTRDDFPEQDFRYVGPARTQINMWHMTRNVLAHEKALYEGHAVAAVADATGRRLMELPMSPPRVKAAIDNREGADFYLTAGQMRLGGALSRLGSRGRETRIRPF